MTATKAKISTRDRIFSAMAKGHPYHVDEWDVDIEIRSLSIGQKEHVGEVSEEIAKFIPAVLIPTCFDAKTGEPIWNDDDAEWFADQPAGAIEPLLLEALKVSGLSEGDLEKAIDSGKDGS